jgi:hypothetical protein
MRIPTFTKIFLVFLVAIFALELGRHIARFDGSGMDWGIAIFALGTVLAGTALIIGIWNSRANA